MKHLVPFLGFEEDLSGPGSQILLHSWGEDGGKAKDVN